MGAAAPEAASGSCWRSGPGPGYSPPVSEDLQSLRSRLDALDRRIVDTLAERDRLVDEVAGLKTDPDAPVRDLGREEALLSKVVERAAEQGLSADLVTRLFQDIIDHSLRRQHRSLATGDDNAEAAVVAFQGTKGSYSSQASARHFASAPFSVELRGFHTFKQAIDAVASGVAQNAERGRSPWEDPMANSQ